MHSWVGQILLYDIPVKVDFLTTMDGHLATCDLVGYTYSRECSLLICGVFTVFRRADCPL